MQEPISILALLKFTLWYISSISIKLNLVVFHYHFSFSYHILIRWQVFPPRTTNAANWIEVSPVFNLYQLFNAAYSVFIIEFKPSFTFEFLKVEFIVDAGVEEEFVAIGFFEEVISVAIKHFLDDFKLIFRFFFKLLFIDAPVFKFHSQHIDIFLLLLMNLTTISDKISHQIKSKRISINKYLIILFLKVMSSWK